MATGGLHHLDLNVSNLARSAVFYRGVLGRLGYRQGDSADGWISFKRGDFYVTLVQTEERFLDRGFHRKAVGVNHLALRVDSRDEVDGFCSWLRGHGVPVLYGGEPLDTGSDDEPNYAVYFEDPDRMKLEVVYMPLP